MAPRLTVSIAIVLLASHAFAKGPIGHQRGDDPVRWGPTAFVRQGQQLRLVLAQARRPACFRWYHVVAQARSYNNPRYCQARRKRPCAQPIAYRPMELTRLRNRRGFEVTAVAALRRPGTHWLTVLPCSPRLKRPMRFTSTGRPTAFSLVVRRDDSYVGRLTELFGVPYVYTPVRVKGGHQTDLRLGADCISLVAYGRRRLGLPTPHLSLAALLEHARTLARASSLPQLLRRRPPVQPGDLIHLRTHVVVVSRDNRPAGLGPEDRVIHTLGQAAEEIPLARVSGGRPALLLRWRRGAR